MTKITIADGNGEICTVETNVDLTNPAERLVMLDEINVAILRKQIPADKEGGVPFPPGPYQNLKAFKVSDVRWRVIQY